MIFDGEPSGGVGGGEGGSEGVSLLRLILVFDYFLDFNVIFCKVKGRRRNEGVFIGMNLGTLGNLLKSHWKNLKGNVGIIL